LPIAAYNDATTLLNPIEPIAEASAVLIKFVRALAERQANLDAGLNLKAANDNEPRILH
jgi:hypothetical protein